MATAKKHKARADVWAQGIRTPDPKTKSGVRIDRSQPCGPEDIKIVEKGTYYWKWQHRNGPIEISFEEPSRQTLTSSPFLKEVYDLEDMMSDYKPSQAAVHAHYEITAFGKLMKSMWVNQKDIYDNSTDFLKTVGSGLEAYNRMSCLRIWMEDLNAIRNKILALTTDQLQEEIKVCKYKGI